MTPDWATRPVVGPQVEGCSPRWATSDRRAYARPMNVEDAARRWASTWEQAWRAKDAAVIAALYAEGATYRSHPMREPEPGSALGYVSREFAREDRIECRFGSPIASGDRAAVEWWATWVEEGRQVTLAGATVLRFDDVGRVVEHVDYWVERDGRVEPFATWGA
jgi:hypothetical protein